MPPDDKPMKILIAVDGSPQGLAAARHAVRLTEAGLAASWHLLNVQPALESGHARMFVSAEALQAWYREEGLEALSGAAAVMTAAGLEFERHVAVGRAVETILQFIEERGFDLLVMGARQTPALSALLLGSVASPLVKGCPVPVTVAR